MLSPTAAGQGLSTYNSEPLQRFSDYDTAQHRNKISVIIVKIKELRKEYMNLRRISFFSTSV
jgi:hypothetical protein